LPDTRVTELGGHRVVTDELTPETPINGGPGNDVVIASDGNDHPYGDAGNDNLQGGTSAVNRIAVGESPSVWAPSFVM
jgi:Ca2+-binding RTX toxin-like protein